MLGTSLSKITLLVNLNLNETMEAEFLIFILFYFLKKMNFKLFLNINK